jgi:hypothetical protein
MCRLRRLELLQRLDGSLRFVRTQGQKMRPDLRLHQSWCPLDLVQLPEALRPLEEALHLPADPVEGARLVHAQLLHRERGEQAQVASQVQRGRIRHSPLLLRLLVHLLACSRGHLWRQGSHQQPCGQRWPPTVVELHRVIELPCVR